MLLKHLRVFCLFFWTMHFYWVLQYQQAGELSEAGKHQLMENGKTNKWSQTGYFISTAENTFREVKCHRYDWA